MQELVVESLVVSLTLIMLDVLVNDEAQMPLAERDDTMEALLFDRPGHFQTRCGHTVRWAIGPPAPEAIRPPSVSGLFMRPALS